MSGKRGKMIPKAGVTRNPKRPFAKGGKKSTRKYACGGKMNK